MREGRVILVWQSNARLRLIALPLGTDVDKTKAALAGMYWPVPGVVGVLQEVTWHAYRPQPLSDLIQPADLCREGEVIPAQAERWGHLSDYLRSCWKDHPDGNLVDALAEYWGRPIRRVTRVPVGGRWLQEMNLNEDLAMLLVLSSGRSMRRKLKSCRSFDEVFVGRVRREGGILEIYEEAVEALPLPRGYQYQHPLSLGLVGALHVLDKLAPELLEDLVQHLLDEGRTHLPIPFRYAQAIAAERGKETR